MRTPIVRWLLSDAERACLKAGLRSSDAFVLHRCPILLASARGIRPPQIAQAVGCNDRTVRNVIRRLEGVDLGACCARKRPYPAAS